MENLCLVRKLQTVYFFCSGQKLSCKYFCPQNDCGYFETAIALWRNAGTPQPKCHEHKKLAKMQVVKDIFKPSFGKPFFFCSEKENPCSFWQWGDMIRPQCYHDVQCSTCKVKKEGVNHDHLFYACSKGKDDACGYFEWRDTIGDKDPFEPFSTVYFSSPPSYRYTIKETGEKFTSRHENRKQAYEEHLSITKDKENL